MVPERPPGSAFVYSDINFIVLGALVERLSGESLDQYAALHVFAPLGMKETRFASAFVVAAHCSHRRR
jgi:CubicO group peptidase (beta-lactamase class C family)